MRIGFKAGCLALVWRLAFLSAWSGTPPPPEGELRDFRKIINSAKDKVFPSVVFLMPLSERFDEGSREQTQVSGSGVIISETGEVATNWHVVDKALSIRCLLYDGSVGRARVIGADKDADIALLQLEVPGRTLFPAAHLGDSDKISEGEFVMAMGAPWGLSRSVSLGIISCTTRFLEGPHSGGYTLWLQTDASINPGNSGGPLVNTSGEIIGINTLGLLGGASLAFSVPSNVARATLDALREHGRVARAWTGLRLQPLKDFERDIFYEGDGVLIGGVDQDSPAAAAGIRPGDLLRTLNGHPAHGINREDIPALNTALASLPIGEESELVLLRNAVPGAGADLNDQAAASRSMGRSEVTVKIIPVEKGRVEGDDFDCRMWNFTAKAINEFANPRVAFYRRSGVYVFGIKQPGNALSAGLQPGDVLLEIDGKAIAALDDLRSVYRAAAEDEKREKKTRISFMRSGLVLYAVLDYATQYGQNED